MTRLDTVKQILSTMSRDEKTQLLQWVVGDLGETFPGIDSRPDVCRGQPCIVRTLIPVWLLVLARQLGTSDADLLKAYPNLRAEDLANAWAYARAHAEEIERQVRGKEADGRALIPKDPLKALRPQKLGERLFERFIQNREDREPDS